MAVKRNFVNWVSKKRISFLPSTDLSRISNWYLNFLREGCALSWACEIPMALKGRCLKSQMKVLDLVIMSSNNEKVYYAVARGRRTGIYDSWRECKAQTDGFQNAKYRKFNTPELAQEFVDFWKNYSIPEQKSVECRDSEESDGKEEKLIDDYVKVSVNDQSMSTFTAVKQGQESIPQDPSFVLLPPSSPNSNSLERSNLNQNNAEMLALHLRFDAFERRFDNVLKDIGAISSELSHLRRDVKELSESLKSLNDSPSKGKDGLLQTTLNFGSFSAASVRTRKNDSDSGEPERKKKFMRSQLSKSDCSESLKDPEIDALDELVANMKELDGACFTVDEDGFVEVYTDGCSLRNGELGAKAGIGIWFADDHPLNVAEPVVGSPTSVTAEIQAARVAMQLAIKHGVTKLKIFTDCEFLLNCATMWIKHWKKNGWILKRGGPVKNRKELEKLDKYMSKITVRWEKVQGHVNIKGNERADRLANLGAAKFGR